MNLRGTLFVWNSALSLLSGYGAYYVILDLWRQLFSSHGVSLNLLCDVSPYNHPSAWIIVVFNLTKVVEWGDTVFLILRKRPVKIMSLHVFHHLCTMVYCLHATFFSFRSDSSGIFFSGMNLFVHFVMYGYWALLPSLSFLRSVGFLVTILQTTQMLLGLAAILGVLYQCPMAWTLNWHGLLFALGMYGVYLYLFFSLTTEKIKSR